MGYTGLSEKSLDQLDFLADDSKNTEMPEYNDKTDSEILEILIDKAVKEVIERQKLAEYYRIEQYWKKVAENRGF